jgi:hypothetical protein
VFSSSSVGPLVIENTADGLRLYLPVSGQLTEDIMLFGQEPCSRGRYQRRNVSYLGLLPPPINGLSDITRLYTSRFGEPRPAQKVFLVTCQQKDGWKALDQETSAVVPDLPKAPQAPATPPAGHPINMHTGCPLDADSTAAPPVAHSQATTEPPVARRDAPGAPLEVKKPPEEECPTPV